MSRELARGLWKLRTAISVDELTKHYRRLCKLFHPDLQVPDQREQYAQHMQRINEAYSAALKKFNIYTYRNPRRPAGRAPTIHEELLRDEPIRAQPQSKPPPAAAAGNFGDKLIESESSRELGRALAILKGARTFFSLKGTDDEKERTVYRQALVILDATHRRYTRARAGQDALYYMAIAQCNLKDYAAALQLFDRYRRLYPEDDRNALFYFYSGLCHHRLGDFAQAAAEYGYFLLSEPGPQYRHFTALVATYMKAANAQIIPLELPYG
ncbi:DnaJ domain-containing protein [bacterium]|nr:DnaJ domain-containing protein [bacterium]